MIISNDQFHIVVFAWMCVCVIVAESVQSGSVVVVSGIYYSNHWWLQGPLLLTWFNVNPSMDK